MIRLLSGLFSEPSAALPAFFRHTNSLLSSRARHLQLHSRVDSICGFLISRLQRSLSLLLLTALRRRRRRRFCLPCHSFEIVVLNAELGKAATSRKRTEGHKFSFRSDINARREDDPRQPRFECLVNCKYASNSFSTTSHSTLLSSFFSLTATSRRRRAAREAHPRSPP